MVPRSTADSMDYPATKLAYFDDMWQLQSRATFISMVADGGRLAVIVDSSILYPQGGGQPADSGFIHDLDERLRFRVQDVRSRNGVVFHYGHFDSPLSDQGTFQKGQEVILSVDEHRRGLNSRLHSAGHLLDICMRKIGLASFKDGKGHHFPDGAFVEYKGKIPANDLESKREALEKEAERLVAIGGKVSAAIVPYEAAAALCGGELPEYIPKDTTPRIVMLGDNLGCPCGGTHVADISDIGIIKVSQIRVRKGLTKVSYTIGP